MIQTIILLGLFPAVMAFAAASDLFTMTISNRLSLLLAGGFFLAAALVGMPLADVGSHVLAGMLVLAISFGLYAFGWIGGGDAKLAAATSLWFGFGYLFDYFFLASILGGALALFLLAVRRYPLPISLVGTHWIERLHSAKTGVPYGIALAAAALFVYPHTVFMRALAG
jgi:prepilin peptidase CpaA